MRKTHSIAACMRAQPPAATGYLVLFGAAALTNFAGEGFDRNNVGLLDCSTADCRSGSHRSQRFETLSEQPHMPIALLGGRRCITAEPCADRSPVCHLGVVNCDQNDAFQLFTYNRSSGIIVVPPAAAGPKAPPGVPQCFNVNQNRRSPGWLIDV